MDKNQRKGKAEWFCMDCRLFHCHVSSTAVFYFAVICV